MRNGFGASVASGRCNQDRFALFERGATTIAVLADGAGGIGGGEAAAQAALERCLRVESLDSPQACVDLLIDVDQTVLRVADGGETTLVVAALSGEVVFGASVGDSIAWLVPTAGALIDLTQDQRRRPLLGSGEATPMAFGPVTQVGSLMLASDGVYRYLPHEDLIHCIRSMPAEGAAASILRRLVERHRSLPDDATVLIVGPQDPLPRV